MDIFKLSSSTGKPETKQAGPVRMAQTEVKQKKEQHRFQPIRIRDLLGQSEKVGSIQKDSVRKRLEPIRLNVLSNEKYIQRSSNKNVLSGTRIRSVSIYHPRPVRRNLNFNGYSTCAEINGNGSNTTVSAKQQIVPNNASSKSNRQSFLLPPNSIKDSHIKNINGKQRKCSMITANRNATAVRDKNSNSRECSVTQTSKLDRKIIPAPKVCVPNKECNSDAINSHVQPEIVMIEEQSIAKSSEINDINENYVGDIQITINAMPTEEQQLCKTPVESLRKNLQGVELKSPSTNCAKQTSMETITVNREEIQRIISNLKDSIFSTEKNLSVLKSTLTYYTRILNSENVENEGSIEVTKQNSPEFPQQNKAILETEIQTKTCSSTSSELTKTNAIIPAQHIPDIVQAECLHMNKLIESSENDKENQENLSIQVDTKSDSFLELENEFFITHAKSVTRSQSTRQSTPVRQKFKGKDLGASLKEYMVLKNTMSFFQTPDTEKFKSFRGKQNVTNNCDYNKMYISKKAFSDLNNLYSESPEYS